MEKQELEKRLQELKDEYSRTKYNKATNKYLGILRAKMAKIRKTLSERKRKKGTGFSVKKTGDATIALVGFPNAGKSSLLQELTKAESRVANYAFTTLEVIPGILEYKGAKVQVLDLPGIIEGAHVGKGGGTMIASVMRVADLLLFVVDANHPQDLFTLLDELDELDIKVNAERPRIALEKTITGGVHIETNGKKVPIKSDILKILNEFGIYNGKLIFWQDATLDTLVDYLTNTNVYIHGMVALNKIDECRNYKEIMSQIAQKRKIEVIPVSVLRKTNLGELKDRVFSSLGIIRIYLKEKGENADTEKPIIMKTGDTVMRIARKLHSSVAKNLRYALVNGKSVKFKNQKVGPNHVVMDEDVVTLVYDKS